MRKWSFLIGLVAMGVVFLTVSDNWMLYGIPLELRTFFSGSGMPLAGESPEGAQEPAADGGDSRESGLDAPGAEREGESGGEREPEEDGLNPAESGTGQTGEDWVAQAGEESETVSEGGFEDGAEDGEPLTCRTPEEVVWGGTEDDSYFADALFIGDSRVVGMFEYGGLEEISTFYAATGLSVYRLFTAKIVPVEGQRGKITVEDALGQRQFSKIYLMVGINELGTGTTEMFAEKYRDAIAHIQELQPDATIFIQSIIKVTARRSRKGDYIKNETIDERNEAIRELADNVKVYYLDVNEVICGEDDAMIPEWTTDGVHMKAQYIPVWKEYLKCHIPQELLDAPF